MTQASKSAGPAAIAGIDIASLDSERLRQILRQYGEARRPAHILGASAIFRASKIITAKMNVALSTLDLSPDRYAMLALLDDANQGRLSMTALRRAVLTHPATTTYNIDALERLGLARRQPDSNDRRGVLVEITPGGRKSVRKATKMLEMADWGLGELADDEAASVAYVLSKLRPT
jgi:DNA-binding MarR family transcriptional regulator